MQFFTLRVACNKEDRVRETLVRKVKIEGLEPQVGRILVPVERVRSIKEGKRRDTDRKLYPGYVFIELELDKTSPMTPKDQAKIIEAAERPEEPVSAVSSFKAGDRVKVTEGPFVNFEGTVEEIIADKGTVKIIATIFGRPTTLELEYWQIEKL